MDDLLTYEKQKKEASEHFLKDALDEITVGRAVTLATTESLGCLINFPEQRNKANHRHMLVRRSNKAKRKMRQSDFVAAGDRRNVRRMLCV